jgi:hypothetical protein
MVLATSSLNETAHPGFYGNRHAFPFTERDYLSALFCLPQLPCPVVRPIPERRHDIDSREGLSKTPCHFSSPERAVSPRIDGSSPAVWPSFASSSTPDREESSHARLVSARGRIPFGACPKKCLTRRFKRAILRMLGVLEIVSAVKRGATQMVIPSYLSTCFSPSRFVSTPAHRWSARLYSGLAVYSVSVLEK